MSNEYISINELNVYKCGTLKGRAAVSTAVDVKNDKVIKEIRKRNTMRVSILMTV